MKKVFSAVAAVLLCAGLLAGCGSSAQSASEDASFTSAKAVLDLVHARDYGAVVKLFREDLAAGLTAEALAAQLDPMLDAAGAFQRYGDHESATAQDPALGEVVGVFVECVYANGTITWQVGFDADGELIAILNMGGTVPA